MPTLADLSPAEREELLGLLEEKRLRQQAKRAETSLLAFMKMFWRVVDPEEPFVDGWPLWVICDHLEAVTSGQIKRLILNVPPGFSKSLLTDVFWPAWEWGPQGKPWTRYIAASYSASLTERDNGRFSRLINDPMYQRFWGHHFALTRDGMTKVENDRTGWKLATSVGGVGTGERGNRVICLPPSGRVLTDRGWLEIGDIVGCSLAVKVAGAMPDGSIVWQDIERYERNPAGTILEIGFAGGALQCTADHLVAVGPDREWRRADSIEPGEIIWTHGLDDMPGMRRADPLQAEPCTENQILLEALPTRSGEADCAAGQQPAVFGLRDDGVSAAGALGPHAERSLLQPQMPRESVDRIGQPDVCRWLGDEGVRDMLDADRSAAGPRRESAVLFCEMQRGGDAAGVDRATEGRMSGMFEGIPPVEFGCGGVFQGVRRPDALASDEGRGERSICSRPGRTAVPAGLDAELPQQDQGPGRKYLYRVRDDAGGAWEETLRSPHRLRQGQSGPDEPDDLLPVLPRQISRQDRRSAGMASAIVSHVAVVGRCEETFNLAVTPAHTYFADGVLVHNCDDPNNPKDVESDVVRDSTNQWLREVMPDRLNNLREGAIICIQQRTHEEDATGTLLKYGTNYTHVCIPMRFDVRMPRIPTAIGWVDPREWEGELAWEERFPEDVCDDMEKIKGQWAWAGQYQQSPTPRGGGIIPREMWNLWPAPGYEAPEGEKQQFPEVSFVLACVDTASTEKEENDPSACVTLGVWHDQHGRPKIIMMDAWADRLKINKLVEKLLETGRKRIVDRMLIENKNNGISVHHEIQRLMDGAEFGVELWEPKGHGDKVARLYSAQPTFDRGDVYAPDKKWANKVIDEVLQVPKGAHDDLADCVSMGILWLRESGLLKTAREYDDEVARRNTFQREPEPLYDV